MSLNGIKSWISIIALLICYRFRSSFGGRCLPFLTKGTFSFSSGALIIQIQFLFELRNNLINKFKTPKINEYNK